MIGQRDAIVKTLVMIITGLIFLTVLAGGSVNDFWDAAGTVTYDGSPGPTVTYLATDLPVSTATTFAATEAIPQPEWTPTQETGIIPTDRYTPIPKITPTPRVGTLVRLRSTFAYEYANIRAKPDIDNSVIDRFYPSERRLLLRQAGEWYEVPVGGDPLTGVGARTTGWIASWLCELEG